MEYITHREWIEIFPEAVEYLEQDLDFQINKFDLLKEIYKNQLNILDLKKLDNDSKDYGTLMADIFVGEDIKETEKRIKEINRYLRKESLKGEITDEDIQRAKEYPFDNLIKLNNTGFAICPFHKEKTPSFSINKKGNYGHCFGCGWSGDTIAFVMETEKLDFIETVKILK